MAIFRLGRRHARLPQIEMRRGLVALRHDGRRVLSACVYSLVHVCSLRYQPATRRLLFISTQVRLRLRLRRGLPLIPQAAEDNPIHRRCRGTRRRRRRPHGRGRVSGVIRRGIDILAIY